MLDTLGGGFTDQRAVFLANESHNRFVETVATDTHGLGIDHAVQGNQGNLGGTTTNIHHHGAARFLYRQTGTNGRSHGLFNQIDIAGPGAVGGILDSPTLHLGGFAGHAHQHAGRRREEAGVVDLLDKVLEHFLGDIEVSDHPILHGTDGGNVAGSTAQHTLCIGPHGSHTLLGTMVTNGHHGRLVQDDAAATYIYKGVGGPQIDGQIGGEHPPNTLDHGHLWRVS